jgi:phosphatidylglycerophosphatase C
MQNSNTAVFDLDDTLLDWDSTTVWILGRVNRSWWRFALAALAMPFALPLVASARLRRWGTNVFLWIASAGMSEQVLKASFDGFAERVCSGKEPRLGWLEKGLAELRGHLDAGSRVAVATAAPQWIASRLVSHIDTRIAVAGSGLHRFFGGWVLSDHCRHIGKCEALKMIGFGESWTAAYSDSFDDLPILSRAAFACAINVPSRTKRKFDRSDIKVRYLIW